LKEREKRSITAFRKTATLSRDGSCIQQKRYLTALPVRGASAGAVLFALLQGFLERPWFGAPFYVRGLSWHQRTNPTVIYFSGSWPFGRTWSPPPRKLAIRKRPWLRVSQASESAGCPPSRFRRHANGGPDEFLVALDQTLRREVTIKDFQERHALDRNTRTFTGGRHQAFRRRFARGLG
jgi:hypothetical protein